MNTRILTLIVALATLGTFCARSEAQGTAREAADMLRALNIQIGEAQRAGDRQRVSLLQNRYLDIQKKWGVEPSPGPKPPAVVVRPTAFSSAQNGSGKITGYKGGDIRVR